MSKAIPLRADYGADDLRRCARESPDANQARRLLTLAGVADGPSRNEAARMGDVGAQTLRGWVIVFNAEGPDSLISTSPPGRPPKLSPAQKQNLAQIAGTGPDPEVDGVVRWRCVDLQKVIRDRYGVDLDESSVGRILKELGFSHVSARPRHTRQKQDPTAIETFKKKDLPEQIAEITESLEPDVSVELWLPDEMRVARKTARSINGHLAERGRVSLPICVTLMRIYSARYAQRATPALLW